MPYEWLISRICEEFPCYGPAEAHEALENDTGYTIFKIMDFRAYAKAKEIYDSTPLENRPKTAMMERVSEITMGLAKKRIQAALEKEASQENKK